jgi:hypothetical protein
MTIPLRRPGLAVPADTVRMTSAFLRSVPRMEACCFWFGKRPQPDNATVEAIVVPRQQNRPGNYHIEADAMLRVAEVAHAHGWKNLAQIHSHPGADVRHSGYDDEMANSRRAFSLVYPTYGTVPAMWRYHGWLWQFWPRQFPCEIGVHTFTDGKWAFLGESEIAMALHVAAGPRPALFDLR